MNKKSQINVKEEIDKSVKTGDHEQEKVENLLIITPERPKLRQIKTTEKSEHKFIQLSFNAPPLNLMAKQAFKYTGCNCRKSQCLKMYCVCFSEGKMCDETCLCQSCSNKADNMRRSEAINEIITKDPFAFSKTINNKPSSVLNGCNCRRSNCTKKYCDCFRSGKGCERNCRCLNCQNGEKQIERQPKKRVKLQ